ncbi:MAG: cph2 [Pseudonocardiales bacterium]|nr:cph2 [Pseudonocardiales bacterium]
MAIGLCRVIGFSNADRPAARVNSPEPSSVASVEVPDGPESLKETAKALKLDHLVSDVAASLTTRGTSGIDELCELTLKRLVAHFGVDLSYIRRHDLAERTTILVAEWPRRPQVPDPDPLGVIYFAGADPVFAATEHLSEVMLVRPDVATADYQERVRGGSGVMGVSSVIVPMVRNGVTTGILGLIRFGDWGWTTPEVNAITAVAALVAEALSRATAEERLSYLSDHDELTGSWNRQALVDHLEDRLMTGRTGPVAMLSLDLDRLKAMNDFLGYAAGDKYLKGITRRLQKLVGEGDFVGRLGADEFAIVFGAPTSSADAEAFAQRVHAEIAVPFGLGHEEVSRTVSIGVCAVEPGACSVSQLLGQADQAVIAAKAAGGNQTVRFTEQMQIDNVERIDVELRLRDAIARNELVLHYQPQFDLVTNRLIGAEALVRWNHPTRGLLLPASFVGVTETTNLSGELGRWVLNAACVQLRLWQDEFDLDDFRVGVNVSPAQLITEDLTGDVARVLDRSGLRARNLSIEITESAVVADLERARATLQSLTRLGVHLAIDDFGTGYSSLAQLKTLPVDTLKIDRGFVTDLSHNKDDVAIVRSVIALATAFGLETIAEGIETASVAAELVSLGCHQGQGYLLGRPVPAADFQAVLEAGLRILSN